MNAGILIWIAAPIIAVLLFVQQSGGVGVLLTPRGALITACAICWVGLPFGGWEFVFKRLMPGLLLLALGFGVYTGLKSAYCATMGANTYKCIALRK